MTNEDKVPEWARELAQAIADTIEFNANPLLRHGFLGVSANRRHFEHADGTPFFWLGDTWWKGVSARIPWEGFQQLTADRKAKGYTVVQIIGGGPFPDEPTVRSTLEERRRDALPKRL